MLERFRDLLLPLRQREFLLLFCAQFTSGFGDWAGRLALIVLVYERSNSALWSSLVTTVSLLPWVGPGQLLATFADRFGRLAVMIGSDLLRAGLYLLLLVPLSLPLVLLVAFAAALATPPFVAARSAAMVDVVDDDLYGRALRLWGVGRQFEAIFGFALGGVIIGTAGTSVAIVVNAATFVLSAVLLFPLRSTPAATRRLETAVGWAGLADGLRVWRSDPYLMRALVLFVGVGAFSVLPEALAVPLAAEIGLSDALVGVLIATGAALSLIVMALLPDLDDDWELIRTAGIRSVRYSVAASVLFLAVAIASTATTWVMLAAFTAVTAVVAYAVAGGIDAVGVPTNQVVGRRLPIEGRTAAMSIGMGAGYGAQALLIVVVGALASAASVAVVLSGSLAVAAVLSWWIVRSPVDASVDATVA